MFNIIESNSPKSTIHETVQEASSNHPMKADKAMRLAKEFVIKAKAVSDTILGYTKVPSASLTNNVYHYHDYGMGGWWYGSPVYVIDGHGGRNNDDGGVARFFIGLAAAVIGGLAFYHLGSSIKLYKEAQEEVSAIRPYRFWSVVNDKNISESDKALFQGVEKIADYETRIFERIRTRAATKLVEMVGIVAGTSLALVGAMFAVKTFISAGILLGCTSGAVMLLNWGMDRTERYQRRDAMAMRSAIAGLSFA